MKPSNRKLVVAGLRRTKGAPFTIPLRTLVPEPVHQSRPLVSLLRARLGGLRIKVTGGIRPCRFYGLCVRHPSRRLTRMWEDCFRDCQTGRVIYPEKILSILCHGLLSTPAIRVRKRSGRMVDYYNLVKIANDSSLVSRRTLVFDQGIAQHHILTKEVAREERQDAAAVGTMLVRNALVLYELLGIARVTLHAGLTAGGAVWPKLGFRPSAEGWRSVRGVIREKLASLPEPQGLSLRAVVNPLLESDNPVLIYAVSALRQRLPPPVDQFPLGDFLLGGTSWDAMLDLHDDLAKAEYLAYFKRKKLDSVDGLVARWRADGL